MSVVKGEGEGGDWARGLFPTRIDLRGRSSLGKTGRKHILHIYNIFIYVGFRLVGWQKADRRSACVG